ncbi:MAG: hypothetical protein ACYC1T_06365 [Sulfuricaulis sp.]
MAITDSRRSAFLILAVAIFLCIGVYAPGLSGPWIFDDYTNIIYNSYLRIENLDARSLYQAAFSFESGPLRRPVSMLSFALNYYFAGGLESSAPFKLTNLVIHLVNSLLVFWMAALVFSRLRELPGIKKKYAIPSASRACFLGACVALIWSVHPIQLTSVLYVVQRMTELAATFTLLGLISYLHGRKLKADKKALKLSLVYAGPLAFGLLGVFSKENAALLPLFIAIFEFCLFHNERPWRRWRAISVRQKRLIAVAATLSLSTVLLIIVLYSLPLYESREFTLLQRLITEPRVLFFYISLLFAPSISRLGHQHDDIAISTSLIAPWTTLPSLLSILALVAAGFYFRRSNPLLGIGLLWFFAGHLIESTIYPLEIAHEHRNYLPSFGFSLGLTSLLTDRSLHKHRSRAIWTIFGLFVVMQATVTYMRATQWANHNSFYHYEVAHHPGSARIQSGYGSLLHVQKRYVEAEVAVRKAAELAPHEAAHVIDLLLIGAKQRHPPDPALHAEALHRLANGKISSTTILILDQVDDCLQTSCKPLIPLMEQWLETILNNPDAPDPGYFRHRLGRVKAIQGKYGEALNLYQRAYESDRQFLHPLFEQINIFLHLSQIGNAEFVLVELKRANATSRYPRDRDIAVIEAEILERKRKSGRQ